MVELHPHELLSTRRVDRPRRVAIFGCGGEPRPAGSQIKDLGTGVVACDDGGLIAEDGALDNMPPLSVRVAYQRPALPQLGLSPRRRRKEETEEETEGGRERNVNNGGERESKSRKKDGRKEEI